MRTVRVVIPHHLRTLGGVADEVAVSVPDAPTIADAISALEAAFPELVGTIRDRATGRRRPYMRYVAAGRDLSHQPEGDPLPDEVVTGAEPLRVIGAIAGGGDPEGSSPVSR